MKNFKKSFLWRLILACVLLTALVIIGGHLASVGIIDELDGPGLGSRVSVIALSSGIATALFLYPLFSNLHKQIALFANDVAIGNLELAAVVGDIIAKRDSDTSSHNFRVTLYAFDLAKFVKPKNLNVLSLLLGAFLHDVGKVGIPDSILLKPGKLSENEMEVMQNHVELGLEIIKSSTWLQSAKNVIQNHHEKVDGSGYPNGKSGENIPIEAKIFAIVDVFDALTSDRPYKKALTFENALSEMKSAAGTHFDKSLFYCFCCIAKNSYSKIHNANEYELKQMLSHLVNEHKNSLYISNHIDNSDLLKNANG